MDSEGFLAGVRELDAFLQGRDPVHRTMKRLAARLEKAHVPYAIVGGLALFAHHYRRGTNDVDILLTAEGFEAFRERFVPRNYANIAKRARRFLDRSTKVVVDILVTGLYPGTGKPGPIAYPDPSEVGQTIEHIQVVNLETLCELKLAARRWKDFADVVELIRVNRLDESFAHRLHPSIRGDYVECLEEKRREDEYDSRG